MQFQSASALWWLLPLMGVIVLLYLLKMRRQDVRVPAVFLWPKLTADVRANAPIQKLKVTLLLILQLLIVAALVLGMANPLRREHGLRGKTTVMVLDASASMGATDVAPTRFEAAQRRIENVISTLGTGDRCALIEAGANTRVIFPLTADKARMRAALGRLRVTDAPNDMGEALRLASALVGQEAQGRIVVFSDGAFPAVHDFSPGKADLLFDKVGTSSRNLAVTAMESSDAPDGSLQVFAAIHSDDAVARTTTATFTVDGKVVDARSLTIPAGQTLGQTLHVAGTAQKAEVQLTTPGDILAADDHAVLFLQGAGTVRALLASPGDLFLERALALEPTLKLDRAPAVPADELSGAPGAGSYDLVVFDGVPPVAVKAASVWSFGGVGPGLPVIGSGLSAHPTVLAWKRDDPLLRYTPLQDVLIQKAQRVQPTPEGRVLAQGSDGPLIVASQHGGRRALYVGFGLLDSDLPLRLAFPIFVDNAVNWLTDSGDRTTGGGLNVRTGQPFTLAAPQPGVKLTLSTPDGDKLALDTTSGLATVRTADRTGLYTVTGPHVHKDIAVNLLDEAESDVRPRTALDLSGHPVAAHGALLTLAELWRPLVLLALGILAVEWWVFVRRS
jgi:Ca-activated chloride channel family protein